MITESLEDEDRWSQVKSFVTAIPFLNLLYSEARLFLGLAAPGVNTASTVYSNTVADEQTGTAMMAEQPFCFELHAEAVLKTCAREPDKLYELLPLLPVGISRSTAFDLGEYMAKAGLAEVHFRAFRMCIRITKSGLSYIKEMENEKL